MAGGISAMYPGFGMSGGGVPYGQSPIGRGFQFQNQFSQPTQAQSPINPSQALMNQYKLYDTGVQQSAQGYDDIMGGYKSLANNPITTQQFNPQTYNYSQTQDSQGAIKNLQNLSQTGGYSDTDIANLRARGISPIRAVYANAQNNLNRQRSLQGGYSPNYTAATAKMARDESQGISDATQNVNARLAEAIAGNKMAIAPTLASATGQESALQNQYGAANANIANQGQQFNIGNALRTAGMNQGNRMQALEGMRSLYGTTPALASLFGNQALQTAGLVQNDVNNQVGAGTNLARLIASGMGR